MTPDGGRNDPGGRPEKRRPGGDSVVVFGHYPPPVTGERLCCLHLIARLQSYGLTTDAATKRDGLLSGKNAGTAWLILGSHGPGFWRDCFIMLRQRRPSRVFVYIHNASWRRLVRWSWLFRALFGSRVKFVVLTAAIAAQFRACGLPVAELRNTVTATELDGLCGAGGTRRLLWMAAITEEKGFLAAYAAFEKLAAANTGWSFDVYGQGLSADLFPLARFHGVAVGEAKRAAFAAGGIMLLPSAYANETQPLCLLEAMSVGMPVVASAIGGIPEMIGEGESAAGICLQQPTAETLTEAIRYVHERSAAYETAARTRYIHLFSREAFDRGLLAIMQDGADDLVR